jgi:AAA domain-containing protein/PEGA domain-containing protein
MGSEHVAAPGPITNPYIVGNPVRGRSMFFGREADFELVRRRFHGQTHGGLLVFCGERRSGKTSILFQIMDGRLGPEFIPVLIDMQSMAIDTEADFLVKIAAELQAAMGDGAVIPPLQLTSGANHAARFRAFIEDVLRAHPGRKLLLLFDEYELFENKVDAGVLSSDVLHILSNLMEHQSVFIIFTGSQNLEGRRREYWKILGKSLYRTISYLERSDALNLIQKPVEGVVRYRPEAIDAIYRLTAGQPFYTQAVCQSLIDRLNEANAREAGPDVVGQVVQDLVQNPLPQMIFLWDGLGRDEKLVLALLAEILPDDKAYVPAGALKRTIRDRQYPLDFSPARIATVLEKLFKEELLLKDDQPTTPGYAFRMDLWRLWVRRMHSVWQVAREEGIPLRPQAPPWWMDRRAQLAGAALVLVAVLGVTLPRLMPARRVPHAAATPAGDTPGWLEVRVAPPGATIALDGRAVGTDSFRGQVEHGRRHELVLRAPGSADSTVGVVVASGDTASMAVVLRELFGSLRVETDPPGADVTVDGEPHGRSPVTVGALSVRDLHRVEARLASRSAARDDVRLRSGGDTPLRLALTEPMAELWLSSEPAGAGVFQGAAQLGTTPLHLASVPAGRTALSVRRNGYVTVDTSLDLRAGANQIGVTLREEPPGTLVVQGDRPASIFVNDQLVVENTQNSGPVRLRAGAQNIHVVLVSGSTVDSTIALHSRERVVFDFSNRTVRRTHE